MMNSKEIDGRIRSDQARAARLGASEVATAEIVEELYLSIFSRYPHDNEREYATKLIDSSENRRLAIEDLMWALMNAPEFTIQN